MIYYHEDRATPVVIHIGTYQIDKDSVVLTRPISLILYLFWLAIAIRI
jgi:hypothetical protein